METTNKIFKLLLESNKAQLCGDFALSLSNGEPLSNIVKETIKTKSIIFKINVYLMLIQYLFNVNLISIKYFYIFFRIIFYELFFKVKNY